MGHFGDKMKIVKTKIDVEIYGEQISLRKPSVLETKQYREDLKKLDENADASDVMQSFLEKMGLPKELYVQLELGHIVEILDLITSAKKN